MGVSRSFMLLAALRLLLHQVLSQNISATVSTTTVSSIVLPSPTHSDVPPPALSKNCTGNSLTSPDLVLEAFHYEFQPDADASFMTFALVNRMAGWNTSCEGKGGDVVIGDCSGSSEFSYDSIKTTLTVSQSWICNDDPTNIKPITFVGTGTVKLAVHCGWTATGNFTCTAPPDTRIPLSLSAPTSLTPVAPPQAAGHANPGCMATSRGGPEWVISDFKWSTGGVESPGFIFPTLIPHGAFQMNVTNTATNSTISCTTSCGGYKAANLTMPAGGPTYPWGKGPQGEDPMWCPCLTQLKGTAYNNNYYIYTNILVDPVRLILAVDQTWYCDDESAKNPVQFTGSGQIPLPPLSCVPRPFEDIWLIGAPLVNGSTCSATNDFTVIGALTSQNKMEPFALQLPRPTERSCTVASVLFQHHISLEHTYIIHDFKYRAYDTLNTSNSNYEPIAQLDFLLLINGLDVQVDCSGWDPRLNRQTQYYEPNFWLTCEQYRDVDWGSEGGMQHDDLQTGLVNFDAFNYVLDFNITWACSDLNPDHKPTFRWFPTIELPDLNCVPSNDGGNNTYCSIPGNGRYDYQSNFSAVIWSVLDTNHSIYG